MPSRIPFALVLFVLFVPILFAAGCGEARIDASSQERLNESIEVVKKSLSEDEKKQLDDAMPAVSLEGANIFELGKDGIQRMVKEKLNGKTAKEVIAEGKRIQAEGRNKVLKEKESEIQYLSLKQHYSNKAADALAAFKVERPRFYFSEGGFSSNPTIELTVTNGTQQAVSRAYFRFVLATPGRAVPWVEEDFNYDVPGGLEPGESATWKITLNQFGKWGRAPRDRDDMVLTATVTRIDGAGGKVILEVNFSESDRKELEALKLSLPSHEATREGGGPSSQ